MLFLYVLSLLDLLLLITSQVVSESEEINKIIGDILSKAEKKNAEPIKFSWNDKISADGQLSYTEHYKDIRNTERDKVFDLNPEAFFRTKSGKTSQTLRLQDIIAEFNKIHTQTMKNLKNDDYKTTTHATQTTKTRKANHSKKTRTRYKNKMTPPMARLQKKSKQAEISTTTTATTIKPSKTNVETKPLHNEAIYFKNIPIGPHDRQFSESIFHTTKTVAPIHSKTIQVPKETVTKEIDKTTTQETEKTSSRENGQISSQNFEKSSTQEIEKISTEEKEQTFTKENGHTPTQEITKTSTLEFILPDSSTQKVSETSTREVHKTTSKASFILSTLFSSVEKDTADKIDFKELKSKFYYFDDEDNADSIDTENYSTTTQKYMSAKDWGAIDFMEKLINSVPNYTSTPTSVSDFMKSISIDKLLEMNGKAAKKYKIQKTISGNDEKKVSLSPKNKAAPVTSQTVEVKRKAMGKKNVATDKNAAFKTIATNSFYDTEETGSEDRPSTSVNDDSTMSSDLYLLVDHKDNLIKGFYAFKTEDNTSTTLVQSSTNSEVTSKPSANKENSADTTSTQQSNDEAEEIDEADVSTENIGHATATRQNRYEDKIMNETETNTENTAFATQTNSIQQNSGKNEASTVAQSTATAASHAGLPNDKNFKNKDVADLYKEVVELYGRIRAEQEGKKLHQKNRVVNWDRIKKFFGHDRVCSCKCRANRTMCKVCAASDAVIRELTFEFTNLASYMNDHCTEIQTFFWMNPSGGKKLRDAVHKIDKSMYDYYKRVKGKCAGRTCKTFATYLDKRNFDKQKKIDKSRMQELLRELDQLPIFNKLNE